MTDASDPPLELDPERPVIATCGNPACRAVTRRAIRIPNGRRRSDYRCPSCYAAEGWPPTEEG